MHCREYKMQSLLQTGEDEALCMVGTLETLITQQNNGHSITVTWGTNKFFHIVYFKVFSEFIWPTTYHVQLIQLHFIVSPDRLKITFTITSYRGHRNFFSLVSFSSHFRSIHNKESNWFMYSHPMTYILYYSQHIRQYWSLDTSLTFLDF